MSLQFLFAITVLQTLSCIVAVLFYFTNNAQGRKEFVLFGALLIASAVADLLQFLMYFGLGLNANIVFNVYHFLELILLFLWFRDLLKGVLDERVVYGTGAAILVFALINLFAIQGVHGINSYTRVPLGTMLIIFCLLYFYKLLRDIPKRSVQQLPMFWIVIGLLTYYAGSFFVMIFTDYMVNVLKDNLVNPWTFHNFLGILRNSFFAFALWLNRRTHTLA